MTSSHQDFGGYSALLALGDGQFLALSDQGKLLRFSAPDAPYITPRVESFIKLKPWNKRDRDIESATVDLATATVWTGLEDKNAIARFKLVEGRLLASGTAQPADMAGWTKNQGPEALVQLKDGRFIAVREGFSDLIGRRLHDAVLFAGDPIKDRNAVPFMLVGPAGFSPTDAAQMPDGRVLILFRRLDWPIPPRFSVRVAWGDPALVKPGKPWRVSTVAELPDSLPVDNFEGTAIEPRKDGRLTVWLISDDNGAALQATYLWKLVLDPAELPAPRPQQRGSLRRR